MWCTRMHHSYQDLMPSPRMSPVVLFFKRVTVHNAVTIAEIAVEKGATSLLMPVACRRQLVDLSDDMATKIDIQFYSDARDALWKAIAE